MSSLWETNAIAVVIALFIVVITPIAWFILFKKRYKEPHYAPSKKEDEKQIIQGKDNGELDEELEEEDDDLLPDELYFEIFSYLKAEEMEPLSNVSWKWKRVVEDSRLWISLYHYAEDILLRKSSLIDLDLTNYAMKRMNQLRYPSAKVKNTVSNGVF